MIPIRLKKDNVLHLGRDRAGIGWPVCFKCFQPVHAYNIEAERKKPDGTWEMDVAAHCCHRHPSLCVCNHPRAPKEVKIITVPVGEDRNQYLRRTLGMLAFYTPEGVT